MLSWFKRRRELIAAEADEFMEAYGNDAYWKARAEAREARRLGDYIRDKFLSRVCLEVAKRTDFEVGVDTATRYIDTQADKQAPYDPGPAIVITRPSRVTLH